MKPPSETFKQIVAMLPLLSDLELISLRDLCTYQNEERVRAKYGSDDDD